MNKTIPEFGIPRDNEERRDGGLAIVFDPEKQRYAVGVQQSGLFRLFSGGVDEGEDIEQGTIREVIEESGLYKFHHVEKIGEALCHYWNTLKKVNRITHATCFLIILKNTKTIPVKLESHEQFHLEWVTMRQMLQNWEERNSNNDYDHWIYFLKKSVTRAIDLGYDTTTSYELVANSNTKA
jgi:8-oxo-dGTP pyrophosphatase MutT (NUDIX family)